MKKKKRCEKGKYHHQEEYPSSIHHPKYRWGCLSLNPPLYVVNPLCYKKENSMNIEEKTKRRNNWRKVGHINGETEHQNEKYLRRNARKWFPQGRSGWRMADLENILSSCFCNLGLFLRPNISHNSYSWAQ